jgi:Domain of unknown function (DUF4388)
VPDAKFNSSAAEGRIWFQRGEIVDAATGDLIGKDAFVEMLGWRSGSFEIIATDTLRPRTIFNSYESLLMETAHAQDESAAAPGSPDEVGLGAVGRFKGVQFAVSVQCADKTKFEHWGMENPETMASWVQECAKSMRALGDLLEAGQLEQIEGIGAQRHVAILVGDEQSLAVGFTRSAARPHIRETMKQIEAKWLS